MQYHIFPMKEALFLAMVQKVDGRTDVGRPSLSLSIYLSGRASVRRTLHNTHASVVRLSAFLGPACPALLRHDPPLSPSCYVTCRLSWSCWSNFGFTNMSGSFSILFSSSLDGSDRAFIKISPNLKKFGNLKPLLSIWGLLCYYTLTPP